jgi:hypothetical protein
VLETFANEFRWKDFSKTINVPQKQHIFENYFKSF